MPNARQVGYSPTPVTTEIPMPEQNVAQDILNLVQGGGKAIAGFAQVAADVIQEKNRELTTYLKYAEASQDAQRELGIAKTRKKIDDNQSQIQTMNIVDDWYEKLRQQEKIGLVSLAYGRSSNELKELLKKNPNIIDPDNLLEYRKLVASQMADMDAAEIFQVVSQSRDKFNNPSATIKQAVDAKLATIQFPDAESQQAYVTTLLPRIVTTNEQLMREGWEIKRKEAGETVINNSRFDFTTNVNSGTITGELFDAGINAVTDQIMSFFPEYNETKARGIALDANLKLLTDRDSPVMPDKAMDAIDKIFTTQPDKMRSSKTTQTVLNTARAEVIMRFQKWQNDNTTIAKEDISNANEMDLLGIVNDLKSQEAEKTYGKSNVTILMNDTQSRKAALQTLNNSQYEKQVDAALETPMGTADIEKQVDAAYKNGAINTSQYQTLVKKISEGEVKNKTYHDVWNKRTNQKASETLAFGKDHFPAIDKYDLQDRNAGMSVGTRLVNTVRNYGVITDNQISEIDGLLNNPSAESQLLGVAAIGELRANIPPQYMNSAVNNLEKLNGKGKVLAKTALLTGINPAYLVNELAGAKPDTYSKGREVLATGKIGTIRNNIGDAMSSVWVFGDTPDHVSMQAADVYNTLYDYNYSRIAGSSGEGADPTSIAKSANEQTKSQLGQYLMNVEFGNKRQVVSTNLSPSLVSQMNVIAEQALVGVMRQTSISSDYLLAEISEMSGTKIDNQDYYSIPVYNIGGLARVQIGTVVVPVDDMVRKTENDYIKRSGTYNTYQMQSEMYAKYFIPNSKMKR